jgi:hypothetical protein
MLKDVDTNAELTKRVYKEAMDALDVRLGVLQRDLKAARVRRGYCS